MSITARECRATRVAADKTQTELAELAGIGSRTVMDFERGARTPNPSTLEVLKQALENLGAEFGSDGWVKLPTPKGDLFADEAPPSVELPKGRLNVT